VAHSPNQFCNTKSTAFSVYIVELQITIDFIETPTDPENRLRSELISQADNNRALVYSGIHVKRLTYLFHYNEVWGVSQQSILKALYNKISRKSVL
jgi:hypothetical protein